MAADAPARFIRRVVANDNDCLFSAILYLTEGGAIAPGGAARLRKHCAAVIAAAPEEYAEWRLGMANPDYCAWIQNKVRFGR